MTYPRSSATTEDVAGEKYCALRYFNFIQMHLKLGYNVDARKRAVNLTLNEDLLAHVREVTPNLSGVVESLLADYLAKENQRRAAETKIVESTVALWNHFADEAGSFADEHSTL